MQSLPDPWTVVMVTWLVILIIGSTVAFIWSLDEVEDKPSELSPVPDPPGIRGRHRQAVLGHGKYLRDLSPWRLRRA